MHLYEADYNLFLKLQWGSRLVRHGEKHKGLNDQNFGSRKDWTAMDPVLLKQLSYNLSRQSRTNLATFDNDASACYDRIIVALAMLAARRLRMPRNAVQTHAEALRMMRYYVKTVHGISEDCYKGTVFEPLFGTGQGSGASPAAWLTLISILLNTIDRELPDDRMTFLDPLTKKPTLVSVDRCICRRYHAGKIQQGRSLVRRSHETATAHCTNLGALCNKANDLMIANLLEPGLANHQ